MRNMELKRKMDRERLQDYAMTARDADERKAKGLPLFAWHTAALERREAKRQRDRNRRAARRVGVMSRATVMTATVEA